MQPPGLLSLLTLGWYLFLIALLVPRFHDDRPPAVPPIALQRGRQHLPAAVRVLERADRLYGAQVGYAGQRPPEALAWSAVARSAVAESAFKMLAASPSRPTRLYALAGLHRTDPDAYRGLAATERALGGTVPTVVGCLAQDVPVARIVNEMDEGKWTTELWLGRLMQ